MFHESFINNQFRLKRGKGREDDSKTKQGLIYISRVHGLETTVGEKQWGSERLTLACGES